MPFTLFDLGACNCPSSSGNCTPCALPLSNLNASWTDIYGDSGSVTLTYLGVVGGFYSWQCACQATPLYRAVNFVGSFYMQIKCNVSGGATTFPYFLFSDGSCATAFGNSAFSVQAGLLMQPAEPRGKVEHDYGHDHPLIDPGFEAYLLEVIARTGVHRYRYLATEQPDPVERWRGSPGSSTRPPASTPASDSTRPHSQSAARVVRAEAGRIVNVEMLDGLIFRFPILDSYPDPAPGPGPASLSG